MAVPRLSHGGWITLTGGVALFFVMFFFKWFEASAPGYATSSVNAWHSVELIRWILLLTIALAFAIGIGQAREIGGLTGLARAAVGVAGLTSLLLLFRIIDAPLPSLRPPGVSVSREAGVFLGLLASLCVVFGALRLLKELGADRSG